MPSIDIDDEVFRFLQERATPLVDSPNSVLRRLLLREKGNVAVAEYRQSTIRAPDIVTISLERDEFVNSLLRRLFPGETFVKRQMLHESEQHAVYFNNFNKRGSPALWYRLSGGNWKRTRTSPKASFVILTNPADGLAFKIPVEDILAAVRAKGALVDSIEVNVSLSDMRWKELGMSLKPYAVDVDRY